MYEQALVPMASEKPSARGVRDTATKNFGLALYLVFVVSWFLHLAARFPILGTIRFDLVLIVGMSAVAFIDRANLGHQTDKVDNWLRILIAYSILAIPFVEWPGSVVKSGIPDLIKAVAFYYFTIAFVKTEKDLKDFILVFVLCQMWRVMEPLYLHMTMGYWGDKAYQATGDFLNRLSGAPHDIVNPNGLAFIACTVLPFVYFLGGLSWLHRLALLTVAPLCIYALSLTGSRSGLVALSIVFLAILFKSKTSTRVLLLLTAVITVVVGFSSLSPDMKDRYLSLVGMGDKNEATVALRFQGIQSGIDVALRRPIFGYGLGTSQEANFNFGWRSQPTHNIYVEVVQELGIIGLVIFGRFMVAIFQDFLRLRRRLRDNAAPPFLYKTVDALQTWLAMAFVYSFASYGLLSYEWYLMGGLLVVIERQIAPKARPVETNVLAGRLRVESDGGPGRGRRLGTDSSSSPASRSWGGRADPPPHNRIRNY